MYPSMGPEMNKSYTALMLALVLSSAQANASVQVNATDSGWYTNVGFHYPVNQNYYAGGEGSFDVRNFFVFNLSGIADVESAFLRIYTYSISGPLSYTLFDVTTNTTSLTNASAGVAAFNDLGTGTAYSSATLLDFGNTYSFINIPLNTSAVAAINGSAGSLFAIGGAVSLPNNNFSFRSSALNGTPGEWAVQLHVTEGDVVGGTVPEPMSFVVWGIITCVLYAGVISRRRKSNATLSPTSL